MLEIETINFTLSKLHEERERLDRRYEEHVELLRNKRIGFSQMIEDCEILDNAIADVSYAIMALLQLKDTYTEYDKEEKSW